MTPPCPSAQVLVVDDDVAIRNVLAEILEDEGCHVVTAHHGAAALDYLHQTPTLPKIILLDVMMPIMDGITFLQVIQAEPKIKDIPVVLLSAYFREKAEVLSFPVDAFLPKPVKYDLVAAIAQRYCHDQG